jgi:hypothetical protein
MKKGGGIRPYETLATLDYEKVPNPILKKKSGKDKLVYIFVLPFFHSLLF